MNEVADRTPVVYRVFDAHGFCLYVGSTIHFQLRLGEHTGFAGWWQPGISIDVRPYPTAVEALAAESAEITRLKPRFNVKGRGPRSAWSASEWVEHLYFTSAASTWERWVGLRRDFANAYPQIAEVVLPHVELPPIFRCDPCGCLEDDVVFCHEYRDDWVARLREIENRRHLSAVA